MPVNCKGLYGDTCAVVEFDRVFPATPQSAFSNAIDLKDLPTNPVSSIKGLGSNS